jgi:excisionase family DNA binding protein
MIIDNNYPPLKKEIPRLLNALEVSQILGLGHSTIYQLIRQGELPCVRFGRAVRVRPEDLDIFIQANRSSSELLERYPWHELPGSSKR